MNSSSTHMRDEKRKETSFEALRRIALLRWRINGGDDSAVPPAKLLEEKDSFCTTTTSEWKDVYVPPPIISQSTILFIGLLIFVLATIWPPLILLFAYVLSKLVPYSFRVNDDATMRRQLFAEFSREEDLPEAFKRVPSHIKLEESYWVNARGMSLCTTVMTPKHMPVQAVVCFCHGYSDTVSFMKQVEYQRLVDKGIAFVGVDYEGHGRSDGSFGLINDWNLLIDDVSGYFAEVTQKRFPGKSVFLMGESMGGAVAFCTYQRLPQLFRGVVFVCPMCKISDEMLPPKYVVDFLTWIIGPTGTTSLLGFLPIAPAKSLDDLAHKVQYKKDLCNRSPLSYARNPRLATARELIKITKMISNNLGEFDASFLILHGKEDRVTDPKLSEVFYRESKSIDKTIRLYDGMWHGLTCTEPDENTDKVLEDAVRWILERSA